MSKETKSNRSPGVIARLMGLDTLPPLMPSNKSQKLPLKNNSPGLLPTGKQRAIGTSHSSQPFYKISKQQQEFKDVFEVSDKQRKDTNNHPLPRNSRSKQSKDEPKNVNQKTLRAKHDSTHSFIFDDLNSSTKSPQEQDLLFKRYLYDMRYAHLQARSIQVAAEKSSYASSHDWARLRLENEEKNWCSNDASSIRKYGFRDRINSSNDPSECKSTNLPTRIVVLKPSHGKEQDVTTQMPSGNSHGFISHARGVSRVPASISRQARLCKKKQFYGDPDYPSCEFREYKRIARKITGKLKKAAGSKSMNFVTSRHVGYLGDESSSNMSDNESSSESEVSMFHRSTTDWSDQQELSSSLFVESSAIKEARRRFLDRWEMSQKSVDLRMGNGGLTLREMLNSPGRDVGEKKLSASSYVKGLTRKSDSRDGPLGISSLDGWKKTYIRNSFPASSETITKTCSRMSKEALQKERKDTIFEKFRKNKTLFSDDPGSCKNSVHAHVSHKDEGVKSPRAPSIQDEIQLNLAENSKITSRTEMDGILFHKKSVNVSIENMAMGSNSNDHELFPCTLVNSNPSVEAVNASDPQDPSEGPPRKGELSLQCPVSEIRSSLIYKDVDQPSPNSVLEVPFSDNTSGTSDCFESVSADLQGLRAQLQLLKLESQAYAEGGPIAALREEDSGSAGTADERRIAEELEVTLSYIHDMFQVSGISKASPHSCMSSWHSLEMPVNPAVFRELEVKYCNITPCRARSERRLLFDSVNSAIHYFCQGPVGSSPWLRPTARPGLCWWGTATDVQELVFGRVAVMPRNETTGDAALAAGEEDSWLLLQENIAAIGDVIFAMLVSELVLDLSTSDPATCTVTMLSL